MREVSENKQLMEEKAYNYLGEVYVKIPRSILNQLYHPDEWQQKIGRLYLFLYGRCAFQANTVKVGKYPVSCDRGEYAGSYRSLSEYTGVPLTTVHRILDHLEKHGLIRREKIAGGTRIYLYGYDRYNSTTTRKDTSADISARRAEGLAMLEERLERGQVYV